MRVIGNRTKYTYLAEAFAKSSNGAPGIVGLGGVANAEEWIAAKEQGVDWYYMDTPPLGKKIPGWVGDIKGVDKTKKNTRIIKNGWYPEQPITGKREPIQGIELRPWKGFREGGYVLASPPSTNVPEILSGTVGWFENEIKKWDNVRIRRKDSSRDLLEDLEGASLVISHSSSILTYATILGIPTICSPQGPHPFLNYTGSNEEPDRQLAIEHWSNLYFSYDDVLSGKAWERFK